MVEHWRHNARDMVLAPTWGRLPFPPLSFPFFLWFLWFLLESLNGLISCSMSLWEPGIANHSHGGRSAAHLAVPIDTGAAFYSAMHFARKDLCDGVIFGHLKSNASFLPPMVKTKEKKKKKKRLFFKQQWTVIRVSLGFCCLNAAFTWGFVNQHRHLYTAASVCLQTALGYFVLLHLA